VSSIQHVALETRREDVDGCVAFYALLGFAEVPVPDQRLAYEARFLQGGPTQIHLLFTDDPVIPPAAHHAIVVDDYAGTLDRLRDAGFTPRERERYWGSPRSKLEDPAGHLVELMEYSPA
jgi:catechol 2,3-dioxygenase-like lactoylglutathione lyase family enzyme